MNIITSNVEDRNIKLVDGVVIGNKNFAYGLTESYSLSEIKKISNKTNIYININRIFHENDLINLKEYIIELLKIKIMGIIFSDMAVYNLVKQKSLLIYNPNTLVASCKDFNYFHNILGVFISPTLSIEEIKNFKDRKTKLFYLGYGKINLFYSKRKILSNYAKKYSITNMELVNNFNLKLNEKLRDENYPIYEDELGTYIYTPYIYSCLKDLSKIKDYIDVLFLDFFCNDNEDKVISAFLNNGNLDNTKEGFLYK